MERNSQQHSLILILLLLALAALSEAFQAPTVGDWGSSSSTFRTPTASTSPMMMMRQPLSMTTTTSHESNDKSSTPNHKNNIMAQSKKAAASAALCLSAVFLPFWNVDIDINTAPLQQSATTTTTTSSLSRSTPFSITLSPPTAHAAGYGALTEEQKAVAEAWRLVDYSFLDRTFGGRSDWFQQRQKYVTGTKYKTMDDARAAIEQMVASLGDKYTRYLSPSKYQSLVDSATGTLAGVGLEISQDKTTGRIYASDTEPGAPAQRAGIQANDVFVEVDGTLFTDGKSTPDDVALKLRGPEGSKVGVVMERNGQKMDYIVQREPIKISSVLSYMSSSSNNQKVGVIRIKSFSGTTADLVSEKLTDLTKKGATAFLIDLRGNPGGLLPGGVSTASLFLPQDQPVVFVVNKSGTVDAQTTLTPGRELNAPVVVLVNGNTASAAEVFTAALKENNRATIVGEQTFGKGVVQTIRPLSDNNGGVAITVARYETPQHHDINQQGIPVDIKTAIDCPKDNAVLCLGNNVAFKK